MLAIDSITRDLLDSEIMLHCLADAADARPGCALEAGTSARRLLDIRRRTTRSRREAALQLATADEMRGLRAASSFPRVDDGDAFRLERLLGGHSVGRLLLDLRRVDLMVQRAAAADLRESACALRAESRQIRRRLTSPPRYVADRRGEVSGDQ